MPSEMLDIRIAVDRTPKNIGIAVNDIWREVSLEVDRGGAYYPPYTGNYHVRPALYWQQRLRTYGKSMSDDVMVDAIPITETSNLHGGKTVVIG